MNKSQTRRYNLAMEAALRLTIDAMRRPFDRDNLPNLNLAASRIEDAKAIRLVDCMGCGKEDEHAVVGNPWLCQSCISGPHLDGEAGTLQQDYLDRYKD